MSLELQELLRVAESYLEERPEWCMAASVSGAHAYGFPSPDSDVDLKCVHVVPTSRLVGLAPPPLHVADMVRWCDVEVDYGSNEVGAVLAGVLAGNGNYVERLLGPLMLVRDRELEGLAAEAMSKLLYRHYSGFARNQLQLLQESAEPTVKHALYALRTALTGTHVLLTGRVVTDVTRLLDDYGFAAARELVQRKREGERSPLPQSLHEECVGMAVRAVELLDQAHASSPLPDEPRNAGACEAWLVQMRRQHWS